MTAKQNATGGASRIPRILVLEDDADTLVFMGKLLLSVPADALPTATCAAARYAAKTLGRFDVIIADAKLPDGDGVALAVALKQEQGGAVVITSGNNPPDTLPEGVDLWLVKPVHLPKLRSAIRSLVKKAQSAVSPSQAGPAAGAPSGK